MIRYGFFAELVCLAFAQVVALISLARIRLFRDGQDIRGHSLSDPHGEALSRLHAREVRSVGGYTAKERVEAAFRDNR